MKFSKIIKNLSEKNKGAVLAVVRQLIRADFKEYGQAVGKKLDDLIAGKPVELYHGTNRNFKVFKKAKSRTELNKLYQGDGIFLTPDKDVAWKYAHASRNAGLDKEVISEIKNSKARDFMQDLYDMGQEAAWAKWIDMYKRETILEGEGTFDLEKFERDIGISGNEIASASEWLIGAKEGPIGIQDNFNIFQPSRLATPDSILGIFRKLGVKNIPYPKIYTAIIQSDDVFVTASQAQAKSGKHDVVIFTGSGLVHDVPEILVFRPTVKVGKEIVK